MTDINSNNIHSNIRELEVQINNYFDTISNVLEKRRENVLNELLLCSQHNNAQGDGDISCLRFSSPGESQLIKLIQSHGKIDFEKASANNSIAQGIGLKYAIQNETSQFTVKTFNKNKQLSWVEQDKVDVSITRKEASYKCVVRNTCDGIYQVSYELENAGEYEIFVIVNGFHIPASPFKCIVFQKESINFVSEEVSFQEGKNTALLQPKKSGSVTKLISLSSGINAWKFKVTIATCRLSFKIGYTCFEKPSDQFSDYFCEFHTSETKMIAMPTSRYTNVRRDGNSTKKWKISRKQSSFETTSITFVVINDTFTNVLNVGIEEYDSIKTIDMPSSNPNYSFFPVIEIECLDNISLRPTLTFF